MRIKQITSQEGFVKEIDVDEQNQFIDLCLMPMHNTPEKTLETVLFFGLESVSYERSRRAEHSKVKHFLAHVFFGNHTNSASRSIYGLFTKHIYLEV